MTHRKPLFTMPCPVGANPRPLVELAMQVRFRNVPVYDYSWVDTQSVAVTVYDGHNVARPCPSLTIRRIKIATIICLLSLILLYQRIWQDKSVYRQIERNHLINQTYHVTRQIAAIKMNKVLRSVLAHPVYIRSIEITQNGWFNDEMGSELDIKKLATSWQTHLPVMSAQQGLARINGGGTW